MQFYLATIGGHREINKAEAVGTLEIGENAVYVSKGMNPDGTLLGPTLTVMEFALLEDAFPHLVNKMIGDHRFWVVRESDDQVEAVNDDALEVLRIADQIGEGKEAG